MAGGESTTGYVRAPSPEEAVAPFAGALTLLSEGGGQHTRVHGLLGDGIIVRTFEVTKRKDGWWPEGFSECSTEATP